MSEIFLIILAGIWLLAASIFDIRKREVPNWLSFSLIIFALVYRAFYSLIFSNLMFFVYGLFGLLLFIGLAYLFYYARVFAGGDAKLLMGLGAVLPLSNLFHSNLFLFFVFLFLLMFVGSIYGLLYSFVLVLRNKKLFSKEFKKQCNKRKGMVLIGVVFALLSLIFVYFDLIFFLFSLVIILFPLLFIYAKSVEESCMVVSISSKKVTIGDWLYQEVKIGKKTIRPYWEGLDEKEVNLLKKSKKKVKIKQGIPFVPAFFIAFIVFIILRKSNWGFF